jgi:hypothetical protein
MKKVVPRITLLVVTILLSVNIFAQDRPKKESSKELAEKGSGGDLILSKREQKKGLKAAPVKINKLDTIAPQQKKSAGKTVEKPKTK